MFNNCIVNRSDNILILSHNVYLIKEAQYLEKYSFHIFCTFYMYVNKVQKILNVCTVPMKLEGILL